MPRFTFALPVDAGRLQPWRRATADLGGRAARQHREALADCGIFRERIWLQDAGRLTPPLAIVEWDCDHVDSAWAAAREGGVGPLGLPGVVAPATAPDVALCAGTTTAPGQSASTVVFALPLSPNAAERWAAAAGALDGAASHRSFLADAGVSEEWLWIQRPLTTEASTVPLGIVHWDCADPGGPWQALARRADGHAAHVRELVGSYRPEQGAALASAVHVRRADRGGAVIAPIAEPARVVRRALAAWNRGDWAGVRALLAADVIVERPAAAPAEGPDAVLAWLQQFANPPALECLDLLANASQVMLLQRTAAGTRRGVLLEVSRGRIRFAELFGFTTEAFAHATAV